MLLKEKFTRAVGFIKDNAKDTFSIYRPLWQLNYLAFVLTCAPAWLALQHPMEWVVISHKAFLFALGIIFYVVVSLHRLQLNQILDNQLKTIGIYESMSELLQHQSQMIEQLKATGKLSEQAENYLTEINKRIEIYSQLNDNIKRLKRHL